MFTRYFFLAAISVDFYCLVLRASNDHNCISSESKIFFLIGTEQNVDDLWQWKFKKTGKIRLMKIALLRCSLCQLQFGDIFSSSSKNGWKIKKLWSLKETEHLAVHT